METGKFDISNQEKIEKGIEIKKILETVSGKINTAWKVLLCSAVLFGASSESHAQETSHVEESDANAIEWKTDVDEKQRVYIENLVREQKQWLIDYIQSPKFKERLTKEYLRIKDVNGLKEYSEHLNATELSAPLSFQYNEDEDTIAIGSHTKGVLLADGYTISTDALEKIFLKDKVLETFFPDPDMSKISESEQRLIRFGINMRIERVERGAVSVVDSIPISDFPLSALGAYNTEHHDIELQKNFYQQDDATPVHEFAHASIGGSQYLFSGTTFLLTRRAMNVDPYRNKAGEIHAFMNELRFLLDQAGIYNTSTEDFTGETYERLLLDEKIMSNYAISELLKTFSKEDLIWFMNNVASIPVSAVELEDKA